MAIIIFRPEQDWKYYITAYPELSNFPDEVLKEHCKRFAVEQGIQIVFMTAENTFKLPFL